MNDDLSRCCNTEMSHNRVNNMWILKNSTSLLSSLEKSDVRYAKSIRTFDFSTLHTSIPHDLVSVLSYETPSRKTIGVSDGNSISSGSENKHARL